MSTTAAVTPTAEQRDDRAPRHVRVAIIGAGFTGLAAVHALREAGIDDFLVLERADDVGGTWRDNTYPGIACDVPSHLYSLSFAPNPDWERTFSGGAQIWEYMRGVARDLRMDEVTRFGEEVLDASWDEQRQRWAIRTTTLELTADAVIDGSGFLSEPTFPAIPGLDTLQRHRCSTPRAGTTTTTSAGKRVAVDRHRRLGDPDRARRSSRRSPR